MKKSNEKRSYPIQFKVNEKEKLYIEANALQYGGSISEFLRDVIFHPKNPTNGQEKQHLSQLLCRHATLISQIPDPELKQKIIELEEDFWLLTK